MWLSFLLFPALMSQGAAQLADKVISEYLFSINQIVEIICVKNTAFFFFKGHVHSLLLWQYVV